MGGCVGEGDEILNKPTVAYDLATATETKTATPTATATETKTATLAITPTVRPAELATVEQKPAEYELPQGAPTMDTILERTKDCQFEPWKKMQSPEESHAYRKLRDTLREQGITIDVIFMIGGVYPEPSCCIGRKGEPEENPQY